jgi:hypothetical protein
MRQKLKINRVDVMDYLIITELAIVGKTKLSTLDDDNFQFNWTITRVQYNKFRADSLKVIKESFRCNKEKAIETFDWFYKEFGLRISH